MARTPAALRHENRIETWLLKGHPERPDAPAEPGESVHKTHPWWRVMCLTGVDYFSTLGYQPGIAALAAGVLSPIATLILVLITLFGALPLYRRVARESPRGEGSIFILERMLSWWQGKLLVLVLLGFVATDFTITITLSSADAIAHVVENPLLPHGLENYKVWLTLGLITLLGAVFLRGFGEAIGIAVGLVGAYLSLNLVVAVVSLLHVFERPILISNWQTALFTQHGNITQMIAVALLIFPRLALGLSGFETGVVVMPLVRGAQGDTYEQPAGRIRNTGKLLLTAACIMSFFLIISSFITTVLIPAAAFEEGGAANGRALAYLAHEYLGPVFGTIYDLSTISILWFAGASAMAGLLNIVPRYLPRYGMAPAWALASRPLVLVFIAIAFAVTIIFQADVDAQGGAYATGVLVLITYDAIAVTILVWRGRESLRRRLFFAALVLVFGYTLIANVFERPDGVKIASFFIAAIVAVSLISRLRRTTELRAKEIVLDPVAQRFINEACKATPRIVANKPDARDAEEYRLKEKSTREDNNIPAHDPVLFLEVNVKDASEFAPVLRVRGEEIGGYRVLVMEASSIANSIAALLLYIRDQQDICPHAYFSWTEGNPITYLIRYFIYGGGDIAPLTREVLREAEPDPSKRPMLHVSGE